MRAKLAAIPLEGKNIHEVTAFVQTVCEEEGVEVRVASSRKSTGAGARLLFRQLKCKHGMPNRQKEHQLKDAPNSAKKRKSESGRTGCPFSVTIRWPTRGEGSEHPYLSDSNNLTHNHQVDKVVLELARTLRQPLDSPMKAQSAKLTSDFAAWTKGQPVERERAAGKSEGSNCRRWRVPPQDRRGRADVAHLLDDGNAGVSFSPVRPCTSV
ncbi:unnamed protein product [Pylaiella littoralis]